jgi:hypothetical protein
MSQKSLSHFPQAKHNSAVATFHKTKDTNSLLKSLLAIIGGEKGLKVLLSSKRTPPVAVVGKSTSDECGSESGSGGVSEWSSDENEVVKWKNYCCLFNISSLLFQQKNDEKTMKQILIYLYQKIDLNILNEIFSIKVCFLLLEVLLLQRLMASKSNDPKLKLIEVESDMIIPIEEFISIVIKKVESMDLFVATATTTATATATTTATTRVTSAESTTQNQTEATIRPIMKFVGNFLLFLYKCRLCIVTDSPRLAKKEIKNALEVFQKEIRKYNENHVAHAYVCLHNMYPLSFTHKTYLEMVANNSEHPDRISIMDRLNQMALYLKVRGIFYKLCHCIC